MEVFYTLLVILAMFLGVVFTMCVVYVLYTVLESIINKLLGLV